MADALVVRCDLHGPYTPEEAALLITGQWKPVRTGYLCAACAAAVKVQAQALADAIDAKAAEAVFRRFTP